ncbi:MAG TPA: hypothetical protein PK957_00865 [Candidatus Dojkabacteria bacterium]|nr:hypothetical protein [Candidatus Dojkabacteria bacterium]HQF37137.1 hypothetical protein [Candidatus Dojkabacteria bacterium]
MKTLNSILKTLFKPSDIITFYSLHQKLKAHAKTQTLPTSYSLPNFISFPNDFWKQVITLYKQTLSDKLERSISIFLWEQKYIFATTIKGSSSKVEIKGQIRVAYELKDQKPPFTFFRKIWIDDKLYSQRQVSQKQVPKNIDKPLYLFHLHTHLPHNSSEYNNNETTNIGEDFTEKYNYSYWSAQDIKTFINSSSIITGLITDKFRLLVKTDKTPTSIVQITDEEISSEKLKSQLYLIEYSGNFGQNLSLNS